MKLSVTSYGVPARENCPSDDAHLTRELARGSMLAAVADGVGSARAGGEAAARALEMLGDYFAARPEAWSLRRALAEFVARINQHLHREAMARFEAPELVTTLSAVVVGNDRVYGVNVGDSPVFLWRSGKLQRVSQAHVSAHPGEEHMLTRAIGLEPHVEPQFFELTVEAGDRILLCTDGVSGAIDEEVMADACQRGLAARSFVAAARETVTQEDERDDATAVVLEILETGDRATDGQQLEVVSSLRAGEEFPDGRLVRALDDARRVWLAEASAEEPSGPNEANRAQRKLVLKFAPLEAAQDELRAEAFLREAWQASRVTSDAFVRSRIPDTHRLRYYVQDYVEAPTLRSLLREGPLPVEQAIELGKFLARAAQSLVRHDLAHGDLKPDNVLVLRTGGSWKFKLVDLGSAAAMFSVTTRAGTASYLAPERFQHAPLSERTEVFTIGVILYEALTGRLPYGEIERFQTPRFSITPKPVNRYNSAVPQWLDSVVRRAIAADAHERYQHYSEIAHDLENPDAVAPFHAPNAPLIERDPVRFYKALSFLLLIGNAILLCLFVAQQTP